MNKKIKILFAIDYLKIGGAPSVVYYQAKYLNKEEFDIYLMTLYPTKGPNYLEQIDFLPSDKIINFKLKNRSLFDFSTWLKIYRFLKKEKFDLIYTHLFLTNTIVRILAIITRVSVIISFEHSCYWNKKIWQKKVDKILSYFTDKIIVSTKAVKNFTSKQEKINRDKFYTILNPIVVPDRKDVNIENLRKELNIEDNSFVILTLGRFSKEKGLVHLLEAAEKVIKKIKNINFLLIGYGHLENQLRKEIKKRGLEKYCQLVIDPSRAKEFLYIGDIFVLPSLREGQSMVTYEAMAVGLPVIASNLDSIRDIIIDNKNGLLVSSGGYNEIVDKIIYLYNNKQTRYRIAQEGRRNVDKYMGNSIDKLESLIKKLVEKKNKK